jgi:SanA protein
MRRKKIITGGILLLLIVIVLMMLCDRIISSSASGKHFSNVAELPRMKTGLLLGTSKKIGERDNLYFKYRIDAAYELLMANKIKYLIVSGDNSRIEYNEPEMMRRDLLQKGIDSSRIFLDYAGFRTFDSIKRLKEVFVQDSVIIISQPFHNERAIYLAQKEKIVAWGFDARDPEYALSFKTKLREKFARVKVFIDYFIKTRPKFLGDKVIIPD